MFSRDEMNKGCVSDAALSRILRGNIKRRRLGIDYTTFYLSPSYSSPPPPPTSSIPSVWKNSPGKLCCCVSALTSSLPAGESKSGKCWGSHRERCCRQDRRNFVVDLSHLEIQQRWGIWWRLFCFIVLLI